MDHVSYISDGDIYEIRKVKEYSKADIDVFDVLELIEGTDLDEYVQRMYKSIDQGYAFRVYKNGLKVGFVYSYMKDGHYLGASIRLKGAVAMAIGLKHVFDICDWHKIEFMPHGDVSQFKSMLTGSSIRVYNSHGSMVKILRKDVVEAGYTVFRYLGIEHGWCNI